MPNSKIRGSFWEHHHCVPLSGDLAPSSIFERHRDYVCFDLETKDLAPPGFDPEALKNLGVSVCCAYDSREDKILTYFEDELPKFIEMLPDRLIVGYNIRRFDLPVLTGYGLNLDGLDVFDLMDEVERGLNRRFIKLQYVAEGTLGDGKSGDGKQAVEWYKQGRFEELAKYCERDVEVTTDVFKHGLEKGFLSVKFPDKDPQQFKVEWT